jgi:hypothetical protein
MKLHFLIASALLMVASVQSQNLPSEWRLTPDGRKIMIGDQLHQGIYRPDTVRSIYLTFSQPNFWTLLQNNYASKTNLAATMVMDGITYDSVGVRFKGQTSYLNTQTSQKKSFNIEIDWIHKNQSVEGYKTFNLNNCYQDESFLREIFYQRCIKNHIPAAKSAFVKLYINGANWGVYPNVQQLNKTFLKEWYLSNDGTHWRCDRPPGSGGGIGGGWGDGTTALNYLGPDTNTYKTYYDLKSTDKANPWTDLVNTCFYLNQTSIANLPNVIPAYLDVDRTLWFLASEVLFSDDDSYIFKGKMDYYAHWEKETGRLVPHEYDGNSVMEPSRQTWSPFYNETNANYPLMNKLFQVPQYRQRYLAHLRTLINEYFNVNSATAIIDQYKALIDTMVQNDPKKLYSYTAFNNEIATLKNFIVSRRNFLLANSEVAQPSPVITDVAYWVNGTAWAQPSSNDDVTVRATVSFTTGVFGVKLFYANGLVGNFTSVDMYDDGNHDDGLAGDGIYGAIIPAAAAGSWIRFYIEATANNPSKTVKYEPEGAEHNVYVYIISPVSANDNDVVINEIMASNSTTVQDPNGEYDDWIELYNNSNQPKDISGFFLTDNPTNLDKWEFPANTVIPPGGYFIVWADEDSSQGAYHCNFKLSASGEQLWLLNPAMEIVDSVSWGQQVTDMGYARVPNGTGPFIIQQPTFSYNNNLTGIAEISQELTMELYPNPAKDFVRINLSRIQDHQKLEVTNIAGQTVYTATAKSKMAINTSSWEAGIYFIRYGSLNKRLVVTH